MDFRNNRRPPGNKQRTRLGHVVSAPASLVKETREQIERRQVIRMTKGNGRKHQPSLPRMPWDDKPEEK